MFGETTMLTPEQLAAFQKAQLDAMHEMTTKYMSSVEMVTKLNMEHARSALQDTAEYSKQLMEAKDLQSLFMLNSNLMNPMVERSAAYGRSLQEIWAQVGSGISKMMHPHSAPAQGNVPKDAPKSDKSE